MDVIEERSSLDILSSEVASMAKTYNKLANPDYLRAMRRNEGLTLSKMARLMHSYPSKVNNVELEKIQPNMEYVVSFYTALIRYEGQKEAWRHEHL